MEFPYKTQKAAPFGPSTKRWYNGYQTERGHSPKGRTVLHSLVMKNKSDVQNPTVYLQKSAVQMGAFYENMAFSARREEHFPYRLDMHQQMIYSDNREKIYSAHYSQNDWRDGSEFLKRKGFPIHAELHFPELWTNKYVVSGVHSICKNIKRHRIPLPFWFGVPRHKTKKLDLTSSRTRTWQERDKKICFADMLFQNLANI